MYPERGIFFVGLKNYINLINAPRTFECLKITFFVTAATISIAVLLGLGLALALDELGSFKGQSVVFSLFLLPYMMTPVVSGLIWKILFAPEWGVINFVLQQLGIIRSMSEIIWLSNTNLAPWALITVMIWQRVPFCLLIFLAGIKSLPREPFESARIDGASYWQTVRYITLPMSKPIILIVVLMQTIFTLRAFDVVYTLTMGGPARATQTISLEIYWHFFHRWNLGVASALSWIMTLISGVISIIYIWAFRR